MYKNISNTFCVMDDKSNVTAAKNSISLKPGEAHYQVTIKLFFKQLD